MILDTIFMLWQEEIETHVVASQNVGLIISWKIFSALARHPNTTKGQDNIYEEKRGGNVRYRVWNCIHDYQERCKHKCPH